MTIDIKEMSEKDLKQKIENIKAEREKTANALKRYEDELEKRKKTMPLGIPSEGKWCVNVTGVPTISLFDESAMSQSLNHFATEMSAQIHSEMMIDWRKALVNSARGEPIDIEVLKPFLRKGWVAMDKSGRWFWFNEVPELNTSNDFWYLVQGETGLCYHLFAFNIKPAEDWTKSLQECGL